MKHTDAKKAIPSTSTATPVLTDEEDAALFNEMHKHVIRYLKLITDKAMDTGNNVLAQRILMYMSSAPIIGVTNFLYDNDVTDSKEEYVGEIIDLLRSYMHDQKEDQASRGKHTNGRS